MDARAKKTSIEAEKITGDNIYKVLIYFDKLYFAVNDVERRQLIEKIAVGGDHQRIELHIAYGRSTCSGCQYTLHDLIVYVAVGIAAHRAVIEYRLHNYSFTVYRSAMASICNRTGKSSRRLDYIRHSYRIAQCKNNQNYEMFCAVKKNRYYCRRNPGHRTDMRTESP